MYISSINGYSNRSNYSGNQQNYLSRPDFQAKPFKYSHTTPDNKLMNIANRTKNVGSKTLREVKDIILTVTSDSNCLNKINSFESADIERIFKFILNSSDINDVIITKITGDVNASKRGKLSVKPHEYINDESLAQALNGEFNLLSSNAFMISIDKFYKEMMDSDGYLHEAKGKAGVAMIDILTYVSRYEPKLWNDNNFQKNISYLFSVSTMEDVNIKNIMINTMAELKNSAPEVWDNPNFQNSLETFVKTKSKKMLSNRINIIEMLKYMSQQDKTNWNEPKYQKKISDMMLNPNSYLR